MSAALFVNVHFSPYLVGGGSIVAERIATGTSKERQVILFSVRYGNEISIEEHAISENIISIVLVISKPSSYVSYHRNSLVAECIVRICQKYKPEFVHFHSLQTMGVEMVQSVKDLGLKCVLTVHDNWWLCEKQFLWHEDQIFCGQLARIQPEVCLYCTANASDMLARQQVLHGVYGRFDAVVHVSKYMKELYHESGLLNQRVTIIENGVESPRASKPVQWKETGTVYFGFLGGDAPHKGIDIMMDIALHAPSNCRFLIVSSMNGESDLSDVHSNGLADKKVIFIRPFEHAQIEDFYDIVDVIVSPSRVPESYGLVAREALIRDKWVLTSTAGGQADAVVEGENGNKFDTFAVHMETAHAHVQTMSQMNWSTYLNRRKGDMA